MSEQTMAVSDDALKLLVAEHGVRGTARLLGMDERQTETFKKRVTRAGWMQEKAVAEIRAKSVNVNLGRPSSPLVPALSPTAALHAELNLLGSKTRLSIARGIAKAGEHIESMDGQEILIDAQNIKSVAQTADIIHGYRDAAPQVKIRLDVLSGSAEAAPIDIEASVSDSWAEDTVDPLDEY
jgi:hypothetical protein